MHMIEKTQRRLRQARFFYEHLLKARHQTEGDPEAFRLYFSAFIQAARSHLDPKQRAAGKVEGMGAQLGSEAK